MKKKSIDNTIFKEEEKTIFSELENVIKFPAIFKDQTLPGEPVNEKFNVETVFKIEK